MRSSDAVAERLAALCTALERGSGRLDPASAADAEAVIARAGERLALSTKHTVVALAGATGSGKSSLFNALCGIELARVGVRRPTTSEPLACVWGTEGASDLLEWLGIPRAHVIERETVLDGDHEAALHGLVLLDLPDHDSTALGHRLEVDRLVELVDLIVWVADPQKYADAVLHERYLRPFSGHEAVTVVVLNQADLLTEAELRECRDDLVKLLRADGLRAPRVLATSARTGRGVAELHAELETAVRLRAARVERLAADVGAVTGPLLKAMDGRPGEVSRGDRSALVEALAAAAGVPAVVAAVDRSIRRRAVLATGWPPTRWLRRLRPDPLRRLGLSRAERSEAARSSLPPPSPTSRAQVDNALRRAADAASGSLDPAWADGVRAAARGGSGDLADALDRAVTSTDLGADRGSWWWPPVRVLQYGLAGCAVVGALWLLALGLVDYVRLPDPPTAEWEGFPLPTLLLLGGVLLGLLLAVVGRVFAGISARGRAARARSRLRASIAGVAEVRVIEPVEAELVRWRETRAALEVAAEGG